MIARQKIYVKVSSDFDFTGYMQPRTITWRNGQVDLIDAVTDYRPSSAIEPGLTGDCYTVVVHGQPIHLFFEKTDPRFSGRVGRWFVEPLQAVPST